MQNFSWQLAIFDKLLNFGCVKNFSTVEQITLSPYKWANQLT